jgi:hypothetical protein
MTEEEFKALKEGDLVERFGPGPEGIFEIIRATELDNRFNRPGAWKWA